MKIEQLPVVINRDAVFQMIECREDSPVYDSVAKAYEELASEVLHCTEGRCIYGFGTLSEQDAVYDYPVGTSVIYVISTIGKAISELSSRMFSEGEYVKGMLVDAMADSALFELEVQWMPILKAFCKEHDVGIRARLEAPNDLPLTVQQTAFEVLHAQEELGLAITSGFMYDPVKTSCVVFAVTEDTCQFHAEHDCSKCPAVNCRLRKVAAMKETIIKVQMLNHALEIRCEEGESVLSAYQRQAKPVSAVCGGKGICGKCRIKVLEGNLAVTASDRNCFSEEELDAGNRLSCQAFPKSGCVIEVCFADETDFEVLDSFAKMCKETEDSGDLAVPECRPESTGKVQNQTFGIAVDIGTTTLAAQLVNLDRGIVADSASSMNHQRRFGADVISRMEASVAGNGMELQKLIRKDLQKLISKLMRNSGIRGNQIKKIMISGNTTMGHLLMGYACDTLGVYPFRPVNIGVIGGRFSDIIGSEYLGTESFQKEIVDCPVWLLPGISTFIGGDIVSGLYACKFEKQEKVSLLIDLGTNGEMAIGNRERLLVTSTAAGPAFEGGSISCGTGSIPGAICSVRIGPDKRAEVETIQNQSPIGICGTGVMEITAELLKAGLMDMTGLLDEDYFEEGYPVVITPEGEEIWFTQKDIREVQLAKSAIRAGLEILIRRFGVTYDEINAVYLAGGMGFALDREAAAAIGLIPKELKDKIFAVGNTSLAGAVHALQDVSWQQTAEQLTAVSEEVHLARDPDFNEFYMRYMMFGEDEA